MSNKSWIKYYPLGALEPLDVANKKLTELLDDASKNYGDRVALTSPTSSWTFERLETEAKLLATVFKKAGISDGYRVAIYMPNMPEYVAALFATWMVGGTVVQVNSAYVTAEVTRILEHSGVSLLVTTSEQMRKLEVDASNLDCNVCLLDEGGSPKVVLNDCSHAVSHDFPDASSDIAVLQYTGGTTGLPKAVMLTHSNILSNIEQRLRLTFKAFTVPAGAKVVNTLPMCHVFGLTCVTLMSVAMGMTQLIVPRFHARTVLELIRDTKPFAFFGVPTMYTAFLREEDLESFGLDQVTIFNSSGAQIPHAHLTQFESRVGSKILDGFGMSESSPTTHTNPPFLHRRIGSAGIPVPFTEARIVVVGDDLVDVPPGQSGELAIKGPQVMKGYWNEPVLTAQVLKDGWLLTGDTATIDEDGYLYIVGRLKEVIVASGYNIYPAEIERVIGQIEGVAEVAVIGVPDDYRGETVKAVLVPNPGTNINKDNVIARCRAELAPFKVPTILEVVDMLPRTAVGKTDKRQLLLAHLAAKTEILV
jgi:long-chain acyl-CoA synthetase